mmetsp:Transcript_6040/g.13901  ORF Transcript_6040/g.13901 Transcript_6040/m.13901 type:complete len:230 (-) Transcript_6040:111-800(-)
MALQLAASAALALTLALSPADAAHARQPGADIQKLKMTLEGSAVFQQKVAQLCSRANTAACQAKASDQLFCALMSRSHPELSSSAGCAAAAVQASLLETGSALERLRALAPEDDLAQEMTHDLEMNFNKIAPFGKEDTAKELQDHAAKTQDTLVDAVENAEVAEIKRAVFRALTRLRAATIKEFDTIARLETQAIDAYNDAHHYRAENPLAHLHEDEAPVETDKLKSFH